jgi:hypothetical protein
VSYFGHAGPGVALRSSTHVMPANGRPYVKVVDAALGYQPDQMS